MPTLGENPTQFLVEMRKKIKDLRRMAEQQKTASSAMPDMAQEIAAHKKFVTMFEELDDWLEEGGDAPEQWVEKKSEF